MTAIEHQELEERIESRLKSLDIVIKLGWSLIAGAFVIGIWVATIQIAVNNHAVAIEEERRARAGEIASIRALELKDSSDTQLLKQIVEQLNKIENKLENIKRD
jgi:hypothetical protein